MKKLVLGVLALIVILPLSSKAGEYSILKNESSIQFSGVHAGNDFSGTFEEWDATIVFDKESLEASSVKATFNPKSVKTGNAQYDGTLPRGDWFDAHNHPEITFQSNTITINEDGSYTMTGDLTIRGISKPISFDFVLDEQENGPAHAKAEFIVNRIEYEMGLKSDPNAEWVSEEINITLDIKAQKNKAP